MSIGSLKGMKHGCIGTLVLNAFLLTSCASVERDESSELEKEIHSRSYSEDLISVGVAMEMAKTSYTLGCVTASPEVERKGKHQECLKRAERHVRETLLGIFDQE